MMSTKTRFGGVLIALALLLFVLPGAASGHHHRHVRAHAAAVYVGDCTLHAYLPQSVGGNQLRAHGALDCPFAVDRLETQQCVQVRTPTGGAATKQDTCHTIETCWKCGATAIDPAYSYDTTDAVAGHVYRTWDWGKEWESGTVTTNTYQSSWWTNP